MTMEIVVSCLECRSTLLRIVEDKGRIERCDCPHYAWIPEDRLERLGLRLDGQAQCSVEGQLLFERGDKEVARLLKERYEGLLQELREVGREVRRLTGVDASFAVDIVDYWLKGEEDWPATLRKWGYTRWCENFDEAMAAIQRYKEVYSRVRELEDLARALKVSLYP